MGKFTLLIIFLTAALFPQKKDPDLILNKLLEKFNSIKDYQVDVKIKVDVDFIQAPPTKAKIYFKQPDKIHIESETFALIPKDGMGFSPSALLQKKYTAIYEKDDLVDEHDVSVVKIIPLGDGGNVILTTLFIDNKENIIRKLVTTTKSDGTFSIDLKYNSDSPFPLPKEMIFSFDLDGLNIPPGVSGELGTESEEKSKERNKQVQGKVYISYFNYKVNQGIPDHIFKRSSED